MATRIIRKTFRVDGVLTDPTGSTMVLSDPTGTYGVKRDDTDAVVVADGTAMTRQSTGVYDYSFTDIVSIAYTYYVEFSYGGATHYIEGDFSARGADAGFQCDFDSLRVEIADFLAWTRDSSDWDTDEVSRLASIISSGLKQVYFPRDTSRPGMAYQWAWLRPSATINTVAPYSTGTVTVSAGVVTLSVAGTFPSWAASGELTVDGSTYTVASRDGDNAITLDDTSVEVTAASAFTLAQVTYALPSTFGGSFDGDLHFEPGTDSLYRPVEIVSDVMIRRYRQHDVQTFQPRWASLRPVTFDPLTGQRWEITFYPAPNAAYALHGRYKVVPAMIDATNRFPLGGPELCEAILESCLSIAEQRMNDGGRGFHTNQFEILLAAAMANDADAYAPDSLGYNADHSDHGQDFDELWGVPVHSFEGTVYRD